MDHCMHGCQSLVQYHPKMAQYRISLIVLNFSVDFHPRYAIAGESSRCELLENVLYEIDCDSRIWRP